MGPLAICGKVTFFQFALNRKMSNEKNTNDTMGKTEDVQVSEPVRYAYAKRVRSLVRSKYVQIKSTQELGALLRIVRQRMNLTQGEAAACCGVGRRFYIELENGKENLYFGKMLEVLDTLGIQLFVGGLGAAFSPEELAMAPLKLEPSDAQHIWNVELSTHMPMPYEEAAKPNTGRAIGSVGMQWRGRQSLFQIDNVTYQYDEATKLLVSTPTLGKTS